MVNERKEPPSDETIASSPGPHSALGTQKRVVEQKSWTSGETRLDLHLPTPTSFTAFPYDPPYSIQLDLMRYIYTSVESRKIAIAESPTGTGKTLSLLCGTLTWLLDEEDRSRKGQLMAVEETLKGESNDDDPPWVLKQSLEFHRRELEASGQAMSERLERARKKEEQLRRKENGRVRKKPKLSHTAELEVKDDDLFLPESGSDTGVDDYRHLSADVREMLRKYEDRDKPALLLDSEEKEPICTKIYYASRTHTQLSQTISELKKTSFGENIRVVPLGSRRNMCINEELRAKGGDLDEGCRELLTDEKRVDMKLLAKKGNRCPYMPPADDQSKILDFRDHILAIPRDIEDIVTLGNDLHTCPYYGSRRAIAQAQLVTLPYNLLLLKRSREALEIDLADQIVVIDEAHNLIDTILSIHTIPLTSTVLRASLSQLQIYLGKFKARLSPKNALHLRRLVLFLTAMDKFCQDTMDRAAATSMQGRGTSIQDQMLGAGAFVNALGPKVRDVNLLEVDKYLRESKIARKISGYCEKVVDDSEKGNKSGSSSARRGVTPPLHAVESFLLALTNASEDGRIFVSATHSTTTASNATAKPSIVVQLKYQLLNPAEHFKEVVDSARSVVLAGGTMHPISDFQSQLFGYFHQGKLTSFACGHVVPEENLKCVVVGKGARGSEMTFTYGQRGNKELMAELGQAILNFINLIPDGVVVFLPSYAFLHAIRAAWDEAGILIKIATKKKIFYEPQETGEVEVVLREYAEAIRSSNSAGQTLTGAIIFAVVGAKLSEGLNFTDKLARAVVLVGLPFANRESVELKERMKYVADLEKKDLARQGVDKKAGTQDAGAELYENLCMKAVNQSIGRAIRHRGDWAGLILIDSRYASARIRAKLPGWIGKDVIVADKFGSAMKELGSFYRGKKAGAGAS
ncbi:ATP-dependent DNA helicase chl1 [Tulasnella sp. 332]|nr:ATP-dependent DNA helicase chl1 [Tulasnella sp. 332]